MMGGEEVDVRFVQNHMHCHCMQGRMRCKLGGCLTSASVSAIEKYPVLGSLISLVLVPGVAEEEEEEGEGSASPLTAADALKIFLGKDDTPHRLGRWPVDLDGALEVCMLFIIPELSAIAIFRHFDPGPFRTQDAIDLASENHWQGKTRLTWHK